MQKLIEKASIDWNNYLTKSEIKKFLSKDDKIESAENIIYSKEFKDRYERLHNDLQKKYNNSWTKKELVDDLFNFYTYGHLITEEIHNETIKQPLNENYVLKGIQNGKSFDISYNDNKEKLQKFKDELQNSHKDIEMYIVKENKSIKTKAVDITKLPNLEYELESRSENLDYRKIYNKVKKSKSGKIRCTYNELDLISAIYLDNDVYDYDNLGIQKILYEDYSFDSYNKKIEEYKNIKLNEFIEKLKNTYPKVTVSKPIHSKYSGDRIKLTHRNLIITIILMELLDTESGEPEYSISYNGRQQYIGTADDVIDYINKYIVSDYGLNENKMLNSKNKLEEVSRNELLVKTKGETVTRYNKAAGYKGFSIYNIDTSNILNNNSLVVTCRVGKYNTVVELEDILYWIQIVAENTKSYTPNQVNTKVVTQAIMNSIDGLNIKVDCECGDWVYRMAYQATQWGYKYGTPENRPANIRNPNGYGALCKHLSAILSNKRWLQQVTSTLLNWIEANIDAVNKYLGLSGDKVLTLPNALARQNAKLSWQNRRKGDTDVDNANQENSENTDNQNNNKSNIQGNNPSTNTTNASSGVDEPIEEK